MLQYIYNLVVHTIVYYLLISMGQESRLHWPSTSLKPGWCPGLLFLLGLRWGRIFLHSYDCWQYSCILGCGLECLVLLTVWFCPYRVHYLTTSFLKASRKESLSRQAKLQLHSPYLVSLAMFCLYCKPCPQSGKQACTRVWLTRAKTMGWHGLRSPKLLECWKPPKLWSSEDLKALDKVNLGGGKYKYIAFTQHFVYSSSLNQHLHFADKESEAHIIQVPCLMGITIA